MMPEPSPMTHWQLQQLFDDLNQKYFNGRLPKYEVRRSLRLEKARYNGYLYHQRKRILIAPNRTDREQLRRTILHEMCHIGTHNHGPRFIEKLGRIGEPWAIEEAAIYDSWLDDDENGYGMTYAAMRPHIGEWVSRHSYAYDSFPRLYSAMLSESPFFTPNPRLARRDKKILRRIWAEESALAAADKL